MCVEKRGDVMVKRAPLCMSLPVGRTCSAPSFAEGGYGWTPGKYIAASVVLLHLSLSHRSITVRLPSSEFKLRSFAQEHCQAAGASGAHTCLAHLWSWS